MYGAARGFCAFVLDCGGVVCDDVRVFAVFGVLLFMVVCMCPCVRVCVVLGWCLVCLVRVGCV